MYNALSLYVSNYSTLPNLHLQLYGTFVEIQETSIWAKEHSYWPLVRRVALYAIITAEYL